MTRPTYSLLQHLLTRSDLARLEVPAATILSWLANAWLEQVGRIPDDEILGDPVFTVLDASLRQELAARLATIGKPAVVLTPLRVRSFLMRAMLGQARRRGEQHDPGGDATEPGIDPVAQHLEETDLMRVLQEAAADLEHDVEAMLTLAQEEAELEAADDPASAPEVADDLAGSADDATWFDTDDLVSELDAWEDPPEPRSDAAPTEDGAEHGPHAAAEASTTTDADATPCDAEQDAPAPVIELDVEQPEAVEESCAPDSGDEVPEGPEPAMQGEGDDEPAAEQQVVAQTATLDEALFADLPPADEAWAPTPEPGTDAFLADEQPSLARAPTHDVLEVDAGVAELPSPDGDDPDVATHAMGRVETFLTELKSVLVDLAHRPPSAPVDIQPLVAAVRSSTQHAAEQAAITNSTLLSIGEKWLSAGERLELRVAQSMRPSAGATAAGAESGRATAFVQARSDRTPVIALAVVLLALCWSVLFWFKTGSPRMALGTLVGANVLGCVVLATRAR
ncbi:MAG TPA: hypothetical protein VFZ65_22720 [Planctomycetota bacterium]|nr:hypothetical protein [Planctomycetota bacterium]